MSLAFFFSSQRSIGFFFFLELICSSQATTLLHEKVDLVPMGPASRPVMAYRDPGSQDSMCHDQLELKQRLRIKIVRLGHEIACREWYIPDIRNKTDKSFVG